MNLTTQAITCDLCEGTDEVLPVTIGPSEWWGPAEDIVQRINLNVCRICIKRLGLDKEFYPTAPYRFINFLQFAAKSL